jgi:hypothetical protein
MNLAWQGQNEWCRTKEHGVTEYWIVGVSVLEEQKDNEF